jgi:ribosomal protein S18 acetylase RimI-like enzyme
VTSPIVVRDARASDVSAIVAFNLAMARETEKNELAPTVLLAGVEKALADRARGRYLVAEVGGEVAGCLLLTTEWSDWRDGWYWWIQSVYVAPEHRGGGVYSALHERVRTEARAAGDVVALRLYVERDNLRAQSTYRRLGMRETSYLLYEELFPT